jgi:hypothetical protein
MIMGCSEVGVGQWPQSWSTGGRRGPEFMMKNYLRYVGILKHNKLVDFSLKLVEKNKAKASQNCR